MIHKWTHKRKNIVLNGLQLALFCFSNVSFESLRFINIMVSLYDTETISVAHVLYSFLMNHMWHTVVVVLIRSARVKSGRHAYCCTDTYKYIDFNAFKLVYTCELQKMSHKCAAIWNKWIKGIIQALGQWLDVLEIRGVYHILMVNFGQSYL